MGQAIYTFADDTASEVPAGFTSRFGGGFQVVEDAAATGGKLVRDSGSVSGWRGLSIDAAGTPGDFDLVVKLRTSSGSDSHDQNWLMGRAGNETEPDFYAARLFTTSTSTRRIDLVERVAGAFSNLDTAAYAWALDTWVWVRFTADGGRLKRKAGADISDVTDGTLDAPTGGWDSDVADPGDLTSGWIGLLGAQTAGNRDYDAVHVGWGGDPAPLTEEAPPVAAPANLGGTAVPPEDIAWSWDTATDAATYDHELERLTDNQNPTGEVTSTTDIAGTSHTSTGLDAGWWRGRVRGVTDEDETGAWSDWVHVYLPARVPFTVDGLAQETTYELDFRGMEADDTPGDWSATVEATTQTLAGEQVYYSRDDILGWESRWVTSGESLVAAEAQGRDVALHTSTSSGRRLWVPPDVEAAGDMERRVRFFLGALTGSSVAVRVRASGGSGSAAQAYYGELLASGVLNLAKYVAGVHDDVAQVAFTPDLDTVYVLAVRVDGDRLRVSVYPDGQDDSWLIDTTDADIATGLPGFGVFTAGNEIHLIDAADGFNGAAAVLPALEGPQVPVDVTVDLADWDTPVVAWSGGGPTYDIQRRVDGAESFVVPTGYESTSVQDPGREPETDHEYRVRSRDGSQVSAWTDWTDPVTTGVDPDAEPEPTEAPDTPTGLTAVVRSSSRIDWPWNTASDAEWWNFRWRQTGALEWTTVPGVESPAYSVTGLDPETEYEGAAQAVNEHGTSNWTTPVAETTDAAGPEPEPIPPEELPEATEAEAFQALLAERVTLTYRYEVLDSDNRRLGTLDGVEAGSGRLSWQVDRTIHRTLSLSVIDKGDVDWLSHRIKPYTIIAVPNRQPYVQPHGVFLPDTHPRNARTGDVVVRPVEAYDQRQILEQDAIADRFWVEFGARVTDEIVRVLDQAGITDVSVSPSGKTLNEDREWEPGTSRVQIVDDLCEAIAYEPVWFDDEGRAIVRPYRKPSDRSTRWSFAVDEQSVILPDAGHLLDRWGVPNRWVIRVSGPDVPGGRVEITNERASSPTSYQNRGGRWISKHERVDAVDEDALRAAAEKIAYEDSQVYEEVSLDTLPLPLLGHRDVLHIDHPQLGVSGKFESRGWEMTLQAGARVSHSVRRTVEVP